MKKERVTVKFGTEVAQLLDIKDREGKTIASFQIFRDGDVFVHSGKNIFVNDKDVESSKLEWDSITNSCGSNWHHITMKERIS